MSANCITFSEQPNISVIHFAHMKDEDIFCMMVDTRHYTIVKIHKIYITKKPKVEGGLWVIIMRCSCRFINYHKCAALVRSVNSGGGCVWGWVGGTKSIWELSVFLLTFART